MLTYKVNYGYYIGVDAEGNQSPVLYFMGNNLEKYNAVTGIVELNYSIKVEEVILEISKVISEESEEFILRSELFDIFFQKEITIGYDRATEILDGVESKTVIPTNDFLHLLKQWCSFLVKYEKNEIPNLVYAYKPIDK